MRIGHGYDAHRFAPGRRCVLGGVEIPSDFGPDGHSDADVVAHALMDALLGAAALGDIGGMFPPTDSKWKDADSIELLRLVTARLAGEGYRLSNADITVVAQRPKLMAYIPAMRQVLARAMNVPVSCVSVKATTEEHMGFTGAYQGIAAHAVVLIE